MSAWSTRCGISLGQLATEEKSNEITAIPVLIDQINVAGAIVTIDAAGCQREIADKIIEGKGDYVLTLKGNQGTLHENVANWIANNSKMTFKDSSVANIKRRLTRTVATTRSCTISSAYRTTFLAKRIARVENGGCGDSG